MLETRLVVPRYSKVRTGMPRLLMCRRLSGSAGGGATDTHFIFWLPTTVGETESFNVLPNHTLAFCDTSRERDGLPGKARRS